MCRSKPNKMIKNKDTKHKALKKSSSEKIELEDVGPEENNQVCEKKSEVIESTSIVENKEINIVKCSIKISQNKIPENQYQPEISFIADLNSYQEQLMSHLPQMIENIAEPTLQQVPQEPQQLPLLQSTQVLQHQQLLQSTQVVPHEQILQTTQVQQPQQVLQTVQAQQPQPVLQVVQVQQPQQVLQAVQVQQPQQEVQAVQVQQPQQVLQTVPGQQLQQVLQAVQVQQPQQVLHSLQVQQPQQVLQAIQVQQHHQVLEQLDILEPLFPQDSSPEPQILSNPDSRTELLKNKEYFQSHLPSPITYVDSKGNVLDPNTFYINKSPSSNASLEHLNESVEPEVQYVECKRYRYETIEQDKYDYRTVEEKIDHYDYSRRTDNSEIPCSTITESNEILVTSREKIIEQCQMQFENIERCKEYNVPHQYLKKMFRKQIDEPGIFSKFGDTIVMHQTGQGDRYFDFNPNLCYENAQRFDGLGRLVHEEPMNTNFVFISEDKRSPRYNKCFGDTLDNNDQCVPKEKPHMGETDYEYGRQQSYRCDRNKGFCETDSTNENKFGLRNVDESPETNTNPLKTKDNTSMITNGRNTITSFTETTNQTKTTITSEEAKINSDNMLTEFKTIIKKMKNVLKYIDNSHKPKLTREPIEEITVENIEESVQEDDLKTEYRAPNFLDESSRGLFTSSNEETKKQDQPENNNSGLMEIASKILTRYERLSSKTILIDTNLFNYIKTDSKCRLPKKPSFKTFKNPSKSSKMKLRSRRPLQNKKCVMVSLSQSRTKIRIPVSATKLSDLENKMKVRHKKTAFYRNMTKKTRYQFDKQCNNERLSLIKELDQIPALRESKDVLDTSSLPEDSNSISNLLSNTHKCVKRKEKHVCPVHMLKKKILSETSSTTTSQESTAKFKTESEWSNKSLHFMTSENITDPISLHHTIGKVDTKLVNKSRSLAKPEEIKEDPNEVKENSIVKDKEDVVISVRIPFTDLLKYKCLEVDQEHFAKVPFKHEVAAKTVRISEKIQTEFQKDATVDVEIAAPKTKQKKVNTDFELYPKKFTKGTVTKKLPFLNKQSQYDPNINPIKRSKDLNWEQMLQMNKRKLFPTKSAKTNESSKTKVLYKFGTASHVYHVATGFTGFYLNQQQNNMNSYRRHQISEMFSQQRINSPAQPTTSPKSNTMTSCSLDIFDTKDRSIDCESLEINLMQEVPQKTDQGINTDPLTTSDFCTVAEEKVDQAAQSTFLQEEHIQTSPILVTTRNVGVNFSVTTLPVSKSSKEVTTIKEASTYCSTSREDTISSPINSNDLVNLDSTKKNSIAVETVRKPHENAPIVKRNISRTSPNLYEIFENSITTGIERYIQSVFNKPLQPSLPDISDRSSREPRSIRTKSEENDKSDSKKSEEVKFKNVETFVRPKRKVIKLDFNEESTKTLLTETKYSSENAMEILNEKNADLNNLRSKKQHLESKLEKLRLTSKGKNKNLLQSLGTNTISCMLDELKDLYEPSLKHSKSQSEHSENFSGEDLCFIGDGWSQNTVPKTTYCEDQLSFSTKHRNMTVQEDKADEDRSSEKKVRHVCCCCKLSRDLHKKPTNSVELMIKPTPVYEYISPNEDPSSIFNYNEHVQTNNQVENVDHNRSSFIDYFNRARMNKQAPPNYHNLHQPKLESVNAFNFIKKSDHHRHGYKESLLFSSRYYRSHNAKSGMYAPDEEAPSSFNVISSEEDVKEPKRSRVEVKPQFQKNKTKKVASHVSQVNNNNYVQKEQPEQKNECYKENKGHEYDKCQNTYRSEPFENPLVHRNEKNKERLTRELVSQQTYEAPTTKVVPTPEENLEKSLELRSNIDDGENRDKVLSKLIGKIVQICGDNFAQYRDTTIETTLCELIKHVVISYCKSITESDRDQIEHLLAKFVQEASRIRGIDRSSSYEIEPSIEKAIKDVECCSAIKNTDSECVILPKYEDRLGNIEKMLEKLLKHIDEEKPIRFEVKSSFSTEEKFQVVDHALKKEYRISDNRQLTNIAVDKYPKVLQKYSNDYFEDIKLALQSGINNIKKNDCQDSLINNITKHDIENALIKIMKDLDKSPSTQNSSADDDNLQSLILEFGNKMKMSESSVEEANQKNDSIEAILESILRKVNSQNSKCDKTSENKIAENLRLILEKIQNEENPNISTIADLNKNVSVRKDSAGKVDNVEKEKLETKDLKETMRLLIKEIREEEKSEAKQAVKQKVSSKLTQNESTEKATQDETEVELNQNVAPCQCIARTEMYSKNDKVRNSEYEILIQRLADLENVIKNARKIAKANSETSKNSLTPVYESKRPMLTYRTLPCIPKLYSKPEKSPPRPSVYRIESPDHSKYSNTSSMPSQGPRRPPVPATRIVIGVDKLKEYANLRANNVVNYTQTEQRVLSDSYNSQSSYGTFRLSSHRYRAPKVSDKTAKTQTINCRSKYTLTVSNSLVKSDKNRGTYFVPGSQKRKKNFVKFKLIRKKTVTSRSSSNAEGVWRQNNCDNVIHKITKEYIESQCHYYANTDENPDKSFDYFKKSNRNVYDNM